ncbi:MAG TPA: tRNA1(Val) (adenine(37)-N6)-methyltransferase [Syntrophomonadaceae bacterium]|nr:tRNA1(Val) (adenine(37)-N6)-methyltransferase [Syntrophomonadaceae bacterium]HPR93246.1 tRNA1(Val) (adenine(37)-N6)-methyltransferase [Syntrophomonadaceae bacterium]
MSEPTNIIDTRTESLDDLIIGGMSLIQPLSGYRFSLDAVLLAYFPDLSGIATAVDLGTGHAIIPHLLTFRQPELKIIGIEIQTEMLERAERSIKYNRLQKQIKLLQGDIKEIEKILTPACAQLVVCNPPFWKKGNGRLSQNQEQAIARHEILVDLQQIIAAAKYILVPGGKLCLIHTCDRLQEVIQITSAGKITAGKIRFVHSRLDEKAKLFLFEGEKERSKTPEILPPLVIYDQEGNYSQEISQMYNLI